MPSRDEAYHKAPAFVSIVFKDGAVGEFAFATRMEAEAFLYMIPWMQLNPGNLREWLEDHERDELLNALPDDAWWQTIARAIIRPAKLSLN